MKDLVIGFLAGVVLAGTLCVIVDGRSTDGSHFRITTPPTLVQYDGEDSEMIADSPWRDPFWQPFTLPPLPRFKPSPPLYNWQNPCP